MGHTTSNTWVKYIIFHLVTCVSWCNYCWLQYFITSELTWSKEVCERQLCLLRVLITSYVPSFSSRAWRKSVICAINNSRKNISSDSISGHQFSIHVYSPLGDNEAINNFHEIYPPLGWPRVTTSSVLSLVFPDLITVDIFSVVFTHPFFAKWDFLSSRVIHENFMIFGFN